MFNCLSSAGPGIGNGRGGGGMALVGTARGGAAVVAAALAVMFYLWGGRGISTELALCDWSGMLLWWALLLLRW